MNGARCADWIPGHGAEAIGRQLCYLANACRRRRRRLPTRHGAEKRREAAEEHEPEVRRQVGEPYCLSSAVPSWPEISATRRQKRSWTGALKLSAHASGTHASRPATLIKSNLVTRLEIINYPSAGAASRYRQTGAPTSGPLRRRLSSAPIWPFARPERQRWRRRAALARSKSRERAHVVIKSFAIIRTANELMTPRRSASKWWLSHLFPLATCHWSLAAGHLELATELQLATGLFGARLFA